VKFKHFWNESGIEQRMHGGYDPNNPATIKAERKRKKAELRAELERMQQLKARTAAKEAQLEEVRAPGWSRADHATQRR
jgi:ribosomal protein S4